MNKNELKHLVKSAITDFQRNKVRTFLTSLGILIGVMSVVLLIALGLGLKNYIKNQFENLGSNLVVILPGNMFSGEGGMGGNLGAGLVGGVEFDEKDIANLKRISEAEYVVPLFYKSMAVEVEGEKKLGYIMGANEDIFKILNMEPLVGEVWGKSEVSARSKSVVLGFTLAQDLFGEAERAASRTIRIEKQRYKVLGVAKKKGDREMDSAVIMPYKTTFGSLNPEKSFFTIYLGVQNKEDISFVKEKAKEILLKRYDDDEFSVSEQSEILTTVNQIFSVINGVLIAIGSISLIVGGIGIMNIMYATVTERIKEVGIRRAVGATEKDILYQFLTEAVLLSVFGGILGLVFAALVVLGIRVVFPASINLFSVVITIFISTAIGVFFGVFPARKAAKLPPIEAIRYE